MPEYTTDDIRNVALVGHGGAGKTTLAEALLAHSGVIECARKRDERHRGVRLRFLRRRSISTRCIPRSRASITAPAT